MPAIPPGRSGWSAPCKTQAGPFAAGHAGRPGPPWSVDELAALAAMSCATYFRHFRQQLGCSVWDFMVPVRMVAELRPNCCATRCGQLPNSPLSRRGRVRLSRRPPLPRHSSSRAGWRLAAFARAGEPKQNPVAGSRVSSARRQGSVAQVAAAAGNADRGDGGASTRFRRRTRRSELLGVALTLTVATLLLPLWVMIRLICRFRGCPVRPWNPWCPIQPLQPVGRPFHVGGHQTLSHAGCFRC